MKTKYIIKNLFFTNEISQLRHDIMELEPLGGDGEAMGVEDVKKLAEDTSLSLKIFHSSMNPSIEFMKSLNEIGLPYRVESYTGKNIVSSIIFDGVKTYDVMYDKDGFALTRMDAVTEAISLLETDQEIKALVALNQFRVSMDIENLSRLTSVK